MKVKFIMIRDVDERREKTGSRLTLPPDGAARPRAGTGTPVRTVAAADLLGPAGLLRIDLDGELYTLRLTRNHRLILTK